jgi:hypothetical protein
MPNIDAQPIAVLISVLKVAAPVVCARAIRPNKAPEPTTLAVTPRALVSSISNASLASARVAPARFVAHLYQNVGGSRITNKIF